MEKRYDVVIFIQSEKNRVEKIKSMLEAQTVLPSHVLELDTRNQNKAISFEEGREKTEAPYILFLSDKAIPRSFDFAEKLLENFEDEKTAMVYPMAYPKKESLKKRALARVFGTKKRIEKNIDYFYQKETLTFLCSDNAGMYSRDAMEHLPKFCIDSLVGPEYLFAADAIYDDRKIIYDGRVAIDCSEVSDFSERLQEALELGVSERRYGNRLGINCNTTALHQVNAALRVKVQPYSTGRIYTLKRKAANSFLLRKGAFYMTPVVLFETTMEKFYHWIGFSMRVSVRIKKLFSKDKNLFV